MTDEKKPRLKVLPEVLPAPIRETPDASVRERAVAHMRHLMAAALAVGVSASACEKTPAEEHKLVVEPINARPQAQPDAAPQEIATATVSATPDAGLPDAAIAKQKPKPKKKAE